MAPSVSSLAPPAKLEQSSSPSAPSAPAASASSPPPRTLTPYRLELWRSGAVLVKFRAHVHGTETVRLPVPHNAFDLSLRSLVVSDSRGGHPTVHFPSPGGDIEGGRHNDGSPTHVFLSRRVGAHISIATSTEAQPISGKLVGLSLSPENNTTLFVEKDDGVQMHVLPSHGASVSVDADEAQLALALPNAAPQVCLPVLVCATGEGDGVIEIAFDTASKLKPAYELRHHLRADAAVMNGGKDINAELETIAFIPNPLPFDLHDVELCLRAGHIRHHFDPTLCYDEKTSSSSGNDSAQRPMRHFRGGRNADNDKESDSDVSIASCPTEEDNAWSFHDNLTRECERRVTIANGQVVSVPFYDTSCQVSAVHLVDHEDNTCLPHVLIRNTSPHPVESGELYVRIGGSEEIFNTSIDFLNVNDEFYSSLRTSATVSLTRSVRTRRVRESFIRVIGDRVLRRTEVLRTGTHALHNKRTHAQDVLVNVSSSHAEAPAVCTAKVFEGVDERGDDGVEIPAVQPVNLGIFRFRVRLAARQRRTLVVQQKLFREMEVVIPRDVTAALVRSLRRRGEMESVVEVLEKIVKEVRTRDMLMRRRGLHAKKVDVLQRCAARRADRPPPLESEWEGNANAAQVLGITESLEVCWRMESGTRMMESEIEKLDRRIDEVSSTVRALRDEVLDLVRSGAGK